MMNFWCSSVLNFISSFASYLLCVLILLMEPGPVLNCPKSCFCNTISKIAYCSRRNLEIIPNNIPWNTKQLNLNENQFEIGTIRRQNFSKFAEMEHLYLSKCGIRAIEVGAFIDLLNLKWLDLSKNAIKDIQDFTFRGLSLEQLFLNGNIGLRLHRDTFNGMRAQGLFLHDCALDEIPVETLFPITKSLKSLWLNDNNIKQMKSNVLKAFSSLSHLRLHDNPLHCNCRLDWLKEFFDRNVKIFEGAVMPSCGSPTRVQHRGFDSLSAKDFRCRPPMFNDVDLLFSNDNGILSCSASGDPAPTLYWVKPNGEQEVFFPSVENRPLKTDGVLRIVNGEADTSESYACVALNEGGNVTLTLNVSWPKIENSTFINYFEIARPVTIYTTPHTKIVTAQVHHVNRNDKKRARDKSEVRFTLLEFVGSILGTFLCTLVICFVIFNVVFRVQAQNRQKSTSGGFENVYNVPELKQQKDNPYMDRLDDDIYSGIDDHRSHNPHLQQHMVR